MNRRVLLPLLAVGVTSVSGFSGYSYYVHRPSHSLVLLGKAVATRDRDEAENYLDINATSAQVVDALVDAAPTELSNPREVGSVGIVGEALGLTMLESMKPALSRLIAKQIAISIDSGSLSSAPSSAGEKLPSALGGIGAGRELSFAGFEGQKVEGDSATVEVLLKHASLDTTFTAVISMHRAGSHWRVVGIKNIDRLSAGLDVLMASRLKAENDAVRHRIERYVRTGQLVTDVRTESGYQGYPPTLRLRIPVRNQSSIVIQDLTVKIGLPADIQRTHVYPDLVLLQLEQPIQPGHVGVVTWETFSGRDPTEQALLSAPQRFVPKLESMAWGAAGDSSHTIHTFSTWDEYQASIRKLR